MADQEIKCQKCGSIEIKKAFLGGSGKVIGVVLIIIGGLMIISSIIGSTNIFAGLIWLLIGIASIATPKYQCKSCGKKFS